MNVSVSVLTTRIWQSTTAGDVSQIAKALESTPSSVFTVGWGGGSSLKYTVMD